jgi:hypothetical protein
MLSPTVAPGNSGAFLFGTWIARKIGMLRLIAYTILTWLALTGLGVIVVIIRAERL